MILEKSTNVLYKNSNNKDKEASASWTWINIEHESLILAQDERWRRA